MSVISSVPGLACLAPRTVAPGASLPAIKNLNKLNPVRQPREYHFIAAMMPFGFAHSSCAL
jgi:hypothetical protein